MYWKLCHETSIEDGLSERACSLAVTRASVPPQFLGSRRRRDVCGDFVNFRDRVVSECVSCNV